MAIPNHKLQLRVLPGLFAYARLEPGAEPPTWAENETLFLRVRTRTEQCVICPDSAVPPGIRKEGPWRIIGIDATLDFNQVGIIASLAVPLADAGISIAPIASFDTDYILVRESDLDRAKAVLTQAGHRFS
ncbi:MAG: ACT domain-containing protein [Phycisphaeraceae bacterium]|nr:ACT domain-containing protein [Phycisphaeraceae bacterium]